MLSPKTYNLELWQVKTNNPGNLDTLRLQKWIIACAMELEKEAGHLVRHEENSYLYLPKNLKH